MESSDSLASPLPRPAAPLRLGVLGCGGILRRIYSPILQSAAAYANVEALCDVTADNLRVAGLHFPTARLYAEPKALLAEESLDAVLVLTSEAANAASAELCLHAGLPVYLEKPPALTPDEYERLSTRERTSGAPLFVAFNRRHAPLMAGFIPPRNLRHIRGRMERIGRPVHNFPYTALHLIDSLIFFAGEAPATVAIEFSSKPVDQWRLLGVWRSGTTCVLEIVPAGNDHREYLVFEGAEETIEVQFPNPESRFPIGLKTRVRNGQIVETRTGDRNDSLHEMGYTPAFRNFAALMEKTSGPSDIYRLASCRDAIAIMSAMMRRTNTELRLSSPLVADATCR